MRRQPAAGEVPRKAKARPRARARARPRLVYRVWRELRRLGGSRWWPAWLRGVRRPSPCPRRAERRCAAHRHRQGGRVCSPHALRRRRDPGSGSGCRPRHWSGGAEMCRLMPVTPREARPLEGWSSSPSVEAERAVESGAENSTSPVAASCAGAAGQRAELCSGDKSEVEGSAIDPQVELSSTCRDSSASLEALCLCFQFTPGRGGILTAHLEHPFFELSRAAVPSDKRKS